MITAVDTNVLLDVFAADARFGPPSARELRRAFAQGSVVACEVVWAEVAGFFPSADATGSEMRELGVEFSPVSEAVALAAGAVGGASASSRITSSARTRWRRRTRF